MKCPSCGKGISPFKVWLITRWSPITCGMCGKRFGRDVNVQLGIVSFLCLIGFRVFGLSWPLIVYALIVMLIDAKTVKLVPVEGKAKT